MRTDPDRDGDGDGASLHGEPGWACGTRRLLAGGRSPRPRPGTPAQWVCLALGGVLLTAAVVTNWGTHGTETRHETSDQRRFRTARQLWHTVDVDGLFPRTLATPHAGAGETARRWVRLRTAPRRVPDNTPGTTSSGTSGTPPGAAGQASSKTGCSRALPQDLRQRLSSAGCLRAFRASYTDTTRSQVVTVGVVVTRADPGTARRLATRWRNRHDGLRRSLTPLPLRVSGTPARDFDSAAVASWDVCVPPDLPLLTWAVSGFADGRTVRHPVPAAATHPSRDAAAVESGLTRAAQHCAARVAKRWRWHVERRMPPAPTPSTTALSGPTAVPGPRSTEQAS